MRLNSDGMLIVLAVQNYLCTNLLMYYHNKTKFDFLFLPWYSKREV